MNKRQRKKRAIKDWLLGYMTEDFVKYYYGRTIKRRFRVYCESPGYSMVVKLNTDNSPDKAKAE